MKRKDFVENILTLFIVLGIVSLAYTAIVSSCKDISYESLSQTTVFGVSILILSFICIELFFFCIYGLYKSKHLFPATLAKLLSIVIGILVSALISMGISITVIAFNINLIKLLYFGLGIDGLILFTMINRWVYHKFIWDKKIVKKKKKVKNGNTKRRTNN